MTTEETIEDIKLKGPYYAAFCLQYTPQMFNHEEKAFVRKCLWIFGMESVQFVAVMIANKGEVENLACAKTTGLGLFKWCSFYYAWLNRTRRRRRVRRNSHTGESVRVTSAGVVGARC